MNHFTTHDLDSTNPYPTLPPQWGEEAVQIMLDAEPSRAVRRRRRLWTICTVTALVIAGGAGVAVATPLMQRAILSSEIIPFVVTVDGESCPATIQVQPEDVTNRDLNTPEGMAAAARALRSIDLANLDVEKTATALPGSPHPAVQERAFGISSAVVQIVNQALQDQGFTEEVSIASSVDCVTE